MTSAQRRSAAWAMLALLVVLLSLGGCTPGDPARRLWGRWQRVGETSVYEPDWLTREYVEFRVDGLLLGLLRDEGSGALYTTTTGHYTLPARGQIAAAGDCWRDMERFDCTRTYHYALAGDRASERLTISADDGAEHGVTYRRIGPLEAEAPPTLAPPGPTHAPTPAPTQTAVTGGRVVLDIHYCADIPGADPHQTCLSIYTPSEAHGLPVLIYVHGGAWVGGDHEQIGAKAAYFPGKGFVLVSVNYRLLPTAAPAEQAADLARAVAWVRGNIGTFGGDGGRLFLLGHSAGAHLSALVASDETYLRGAGLDLSAVRGVVLLDSAAYDVEHLMRSPDGREDTFRTAFGSDPATWRSLSPRAHVAPGKGIAPHFLLLATANGQRRPAAEGLAASLRAAGVYAMVADATAFRDHASIDSRLGELGDTPTLAVQAFLDMLLAGPPVGLGSQFVLPSVP